MCFAVNPTQHAVHTFDAGGSGRDADRPVTGQRDLQPHRIEHQTPRGRVEAKQPVPQRVGENGDRKVPQHRLANRGAGLVREHREQRRHRRPEHRVGGLTGQVGSDLGDQQGGQHVGRGEGFEQQRGLLARQIAQQSTHRRQRAPKLRRQQRERVGHQPRERHLARVRLQVAKGRFPLFGQDQVGARHVGRGVHAASSAGSD